MDRDGNHLLPLWFRASLQLHRWASLLATPFFLILCVTGSILIFHLQVDRLLGDVPPGAAAPVHPLTVGQLERAALKQARGETVQSVSIDPDQPGEALVSLAPPGPSRLDDGRPILLDRGTGRPLRFSDPDATFTGTLLKLHSKWFAGVPGELFGALVALLVLAALISGVLVYSPFMRHVAFGEIRRGRGEKLRQLDLHNLIGIVVLGWAGLVAITGLALGLGTLALGVWQDTELRAMAGAHAASAPAKRVPVDRAVEAARAVLPDRDAQLVIWPDTDLSSPRHFTVLMFGRQAWNERLFDVVLVDAGTGQVAAARPLPFYLQAIVLAGPLHFGDYGGVPLKLLWLANAWGALFITGNGAWLWWSKRRPRRHSGRMPALWAAE